MLETVILLAIGLIVGWNFPQPDYAKAIQAKILGIFKK